MYENLHQSDTDTFERPKLWYVFNIEDMRSIAENLAVKEAIEFLIQYNIVTPENPAATMPMCDGTTWLTTGQAISGR